MKKIIILAIIIIAVILISKSRDKEKTIITVETQSESQNLNWQEFQSKASSDNAVVVDIRTAGEYNAGKLFPDALVDFDYYESDFEQKVSELDKDKTYLIYCRSGNRSGKSIQIFEKYGLKVYDLDGGHKATPTGSLK